MESHSLPQTYSNQPDGLDVSDRLAETVPRIRLLLAALFYLVAAVAITMGPRIPLPNDGVFDAVLYLMWNGGGTVSRILTPIFNLGGAVHLTAALALAMGAMVPDVASMRLFRAVVIRFYKFAIALPAYSIATANLARFVGNGVYALARGVTWDATPMIARFESHFIEALQAGFGSETFKAVAAYAYAAGWLLPIALAGFALVLANRRDTLNVLTTSYVLASILAVPMFLAAPVFNPWSTNALYGASPALSTVQYWYPHPDLMALRVINRDFHWASGCALPSLHVAFPVAASRVFWKHRLKFGSILMALVAAITTFVVVYLGRHWLTDAVAALAFGWFVAYLSERFWRMVRPMAEDSGFGIRDAA